MTGASSARAKALYDAMMTLFEAGFAGAPSPVGDAGWPFKWLRDHGLAEWNHHDARSMTLLSHDGIDLYYMLRRAEAIGYQRGHDDEQARAKAALTKEEKVA